MTHFVFILLTILNLSYAQEDSIKKENVDVIIGLGKSMTFDFDVDTKIRPDQSGLLSLEFIPINREIVILGEKPGTTILRVRDRHGKVKKILEITVRATNHTKVIQELQDALKDIEGVEIGVLGDSVYVGGEIVVPSDIGKIAVVLEKYEDVLRLVELSPQTQRVIAQKMQDEIQQNDMRDVKVRVVNKRFWIEGVVNSDAKKTHAFEIAKAYLPDRIQSLAARTDSVQSITESGLPLRNFITVNVQSQPKPLPKMVKISAQFVELTKNYNKIFSFRWNPFLTEGKGSISFGKTVDGGVTTNDNNTFSGTISNLIPKLASAKNAGYARIVQSGMIIVQNESKGNIKKSSVKRFSLGSGEFLTSEKAEAGFDMKIQPSIRSNDKIHLNISVAVSSNVGTPPETLSNNLDTQLIVKSGESAVIGGVVVNTSSTNFDNPDQNADSIPEGSSSLFSFLRAKAYKTEKSQFVVFVTPTVIDSASEGTESIKKKFRRRRQ
ncbi:MAG: hypothetical protein H6622_02275 [Halobacteriovoraceae bacterium]|nr:hypothetical protein [Halobacteriovoraceae bacterium]